MVSWNEVELIVSLSKRNRREKKILYKHTIFIKPSFGPAEENNSTGNLTSNKSIKLRVNLIAALHPRFSVEIFLPFSL